MRRGREGRKRKRIETRGMSSLFFFFFLFFLLKYVGKIFLNTRKAGNSSVPTSFSREMKLPLVGQREQPGGKLDRFVAGECKFLHLISCIFFLFLFSSPAFLFLLNCSFLSIDNFFFNRLFFTKFVKFPSSLIIFFDHLYTKEAKVGKIISICKIKKKKERKRKR